MIRYCLILLFITAITLPFSTSAISAESYVSDEIGVTMRSGPTNRFRTIGDLRAGTPIQVLQADLANKTTQVRTSAGKTGWIKTQYISSKKTILAQFQELQQANSRLTQQASSLNQQIVSKKNLSSQNESLQLKVSELENQVDQLSQQESLQKSRFFKEYFFSGVIAVLIGMLIAWIATRTIYSRRQRSGWR